MTEQPQQASGTVSRMESMFEADVLKPMQDFQDPSQEWRRLFSELLGTFFLVLVAAGGGMMGAGVPEHDQPDRGGGRAGADGDGDHPVHGQGVRRASEPGGERRLRAARGLSVAAGAGLHRRPAGRRGAGGVVPAERDQRVGVVRVQLSRRRATSRHDAFLMEVVLTFGLVSVILGTASGAQNLGVIGALGVGGYIALAGLWGSPISGASMNPARTFGPDLVGGRLHQLLGLRRRPTGGCWHRGRRRLRPAWPRAAARRDQGQPRARSTPRSNTPTRLDPLRSD